MTELTTLLLKLPRATEVTPEAAQTFLAALTQLNTVSSLKKLFGARPQSFALEIALVDQQIKFQVTCESELVPFIETQIQSNYPLVIIEKIKDPFGQPLAGGAEKQELKLVRLYLKGGNYYPIATFPTFQDVDPLSSILSVLAKGGPEQLTLIQYALESTSPSWQAQGERYAEQGTKNEDGTYSPRADAAIIKEKISYPGFKVSVRAASNSNKALREVANAFGVFTKADGNSFYAKKPSRLKINKEIESLKKRQVSDHQILNIAELATVWHLPSEKIKTPSIVWGTSVLSEAPNNLPVALDKTDEEKQHINFFAKTLFKNRETIFGVKDLDRLRHIWTVGKTGTGKSTMIANMAIDDFKKGRGVAIIDPHGDLCDDLLDYIPRSRINDTIYFNPADKEYPIIVNPLEVTNREEAELVVSGLMSIFTKVWANVWSARMEYILRNSFMTLAEVQNTTLADVLKLLANKSYRNRVLTKINDQALIHFWTQEYEKMPERLQKEAISPIQNKVGQFVTSPLIRRVIGSPKSTISIDDVLNNSKIFIANLSQGRLGEDNSALLGATLITKFQLSTMRRVDLPKDQRIPFYLYVDEFQNFATESFIKILSEARKYALALTLANQYMAQIPEEVQKAILGNAGTLISFSVGAEDARVIHKEYAEVFSENDLVSLRNFQIATKLMIDGHATRPFLAHTLPLPVSRNQNRQKVIRISRERYARKVKEEKAVPLDKGVRPEPPPSQPKRPIERPRSRPGKQVKPRPSQFQPSRQTGQQRKPLEKRKGNYRRDRASARPKRERGRARTDTSPKQESAVLQKPASGTVFESDQGS